MGKENLTSIILNAVALGMGVSGIVLSFLAQVPEAVPVLFGIAIFCLAINGLDMADKD
jgi:hypothetical protein